MLGVHVVVNEKRRCNCLFQEKREMMRIQFGVLILNKEKKNMHKLVYWSSQLSILSLSLTSR